MRQLVTAVLFTVVVVAFAMANSHHVELYYLLGEPVRMRLVFLLLIAFATGAAVAWFYQIIQRMGMNRRRRSRSRAEIDVDVDTEF